jgi:TolC family type I secretion outer membrane protein
MAKFKNKAMIITAGLMLWQQVIFAAPQTLTLAECVDLALKNNHTIRLANESQLQSQLGIDVAKAGQLPTASLGSGYNWQSGSNQDSLNNSLRLSWQVYNGGQTGTRIDQAKIDGAIADLGMAEAKQQVKLDATTAYYNVLEAQDMLNVNQETVNNLQNHLQIVQSRFDVGLVAKADVLRAEVELAYAQQNLIAAQNQRDLAQNALLNVLNLDAGTEITLADGLQYQADTRTLAELIDLSKQNRPEVAEAKLNVAKADKSVDIANSDKLPSVGLSASTGWKDSLLPNDNDWSVGLSASWNIFDGGVTKAKINQAESSRNQSELKVEQTLDTVEQDVRQSYLSMKEAEKRLQTTQTAVDKAAEDVYIAQEKYKVGAGTNLDAIDAQLSLTQAKTNHVKALYDYNVNKAKLDKAVGSPV